ncbi:RecQ family ATP-dependent DNA helicase [Treponema ruminis]|uniref:ATP-dependent DNA helicase RecQ n=1 Tax=Treponema ruminis TaxID=744515 RepID=A0A7W8G6U5_9SPIR|nr:RecQ family ATP-dependent DNA helicase [Treponema ruminis]MBB5224819.1 ATP-dependent DNA helicase RecQ [Treponema ruminis]
MAENEKVSFDGIGVAEGCADELFDADKAVQAARAGFHVSYLFPWQRIVIANIMDGEAALQADSDFSENHDDDDLYRGRQIVLLPTGAGKSMCFLVPALLLEGATLVIYPLLALMSDQKRRMEQAGIRCVVFKGGQTAEEREENFSALEDKENPARVIIANPEVLCGENLLERLSKVKISHISIDEAHCVSEWGDSFRPSYLELGRVIKTLGVKLITAFTATASKPVLDRIGEILFDGNYHLVRGASDRANIHYAVRYAYAKKKAALELALTMKKPLIIFCGSRRRTEEMAHVCSSYFGREKTRFYHAGLTREEKRAVEEWFFNSTDGILTATCAYGMGVDKSDIASVIHLDAPEHLENFVQEAGRAGRNGANVNSVLIWNHADFVRWRQAEEGSRERALGDFALSKTCRRQMILDYLGGEETVCSGCDICDVNAKNQKISYKAPDAELAFNFIRKNRRLYTRQEATGELTELFNKRNLGIFGINVWDAKDTAEILSQLFSEKKLRICGTFWKDRLDIIKKKKGKNLLALIPRRHLHRLHHLRRNFLQVQERARQLLS